MLSHKQRNDWCTVVSAHLGEQQQQLPFDEHLAPRWLKCAGCKLTNNDSISKHNPNIIHRKLLAHSVTCKCRNPKYWFLKS